MFIEAEKYLVPIANSETRTRKSHTFKYRIPRISKGLLKFSFFLDLYENGILCRKRL